MSDAFIHHCVFYTTIGDSMLPSMTVLERPVRMSE